MYTIIQVKKMFEKTFYFITVSFFIYTSYYLYDE